MSISTRLRAAGVLSVLALAALPAAASAHPGVYVVDAVINNGAAPAVKHQTQYAISNDGWALGFREDNGRAADGGLINYKVIPGNIRPADPAAKLNFAGAQTGVQAHATCENATGIADAELLAWQGNDPFYHYIPWQKASAGLGDDPAKWLPVVQAATGIDLSTTSDLKAACESAPVNGTYRAADTPANIANATVTAATAPLQAQITSFQDQVTRMQSQFTSLSRDYDVLRSAKAASDAAAAAAQPAAARPAPAPAPRPLTMTLAAKRFSADDAVVMLTGPVGGSVTVNAQIGARRAAALGLSSRVVARATSTIDAEGAVLVTLKPSKAAAKALAKRGGSTPVTLSAASGIQTATASATLSR